jgi:low affinity Fe/Cu permease
VSLPSDRVAEALASEQRPSVRHSHVLTRWVGSPWAFVAVVLALVVWLVAGAVTDFSRGWELTATVGVPVLALLALVILQHTQNHDDQALHVKLDEILRAIEDADTRLVGVEDADTDGIEEVRAEYRRQRPAPTPQD